jgi:copper(I)-binding protein
VSRTRRAARTAAALVAAVVALVALTGCGSGLKALTDQSFDPSNGVDTSVGDIQVSNLLVFTTADGAELSAGLVNNGDAPDQLTAVTVETSPPASLPAPIDVPPDTNVSLGTGDTRVFIHDFGGQPGQLVKVTMTFRDAGILSTQTLVTTETDVTG